MKFSKHRHIFVSLLGLLVASAIPVWLWGGNKQYGYEICKNGEYLYFQTVSNVAVADEDEYVAGQLFVQWKNQGIAPFEFPLRQINERAEPLLAIFDRYEVQSCRQAFPRLRNLSSVYKIQFSASTRHTAAFIRALEASGYFEYVERVPMAHTNYTPNDIATQQQWYFNMISAPAAWDISQGSAAITVAIVDDAVRTTHQELAPNLWQNTAEIAGNGADDDGNGYIDDKSGWDAADNDGNPNPPASASNNNFSHGTHCAGVVSARTDNGSGIAALGFNVRLMPIKCSPDASATPNNLPNVAEGMEYAIANGADVINMSWSFYPFSLTLQFLCQEAENAGIVLVGASGNDGTIAVTYPSAYPTVLGVGASDKYNAREASSNYGPVVKAFAPGENIYSCSATSDNAYTAYSGTSPATAMVSALAALMRSHDPNLTPKRIRKCITETLDEMNSTYILPGRINAEEALKCLNIPPFAFFMADSLTVENITVCPGASITFQDTSYGPDINSWNWTFAGGQPAVSNIPNPTVTFNTAGDYDVTLTVSNPYGSDSQTLTVHVAQPSAVLSGDTIIINGMGTELQFTFDGTPPYSLTYNNGTSNITITDITENPFFLPLNPTITAADEESQVYQYTFVSASDAYCDMNISGTATVTVLDIDACVDCPYDYVQNTFLGGGCVSAFNVTYKGSSQGIGRFEKGSNLDIGFDKGIYLVTGNANDLLEGPNQSGGTSFNVPPIGNNSCSPGNAGADGDLDLNLSVGAGLCTNDAAVLEFDFIPSTPNIKFNYVFASEEYPEYVCSSFNDVFGFFISGPGISGPYTDNAVNIALIPNTNLPVTINNVNSWASVNGTPPVGNCIDTYDDLHVQLNTGDPQSEFDGFTVPLTARILGLTPCQVYHIKIAVADVSDEILDSGVFLEAKSFTDEGNAPNVVANGFFDQGTGLFSTYEGCESAFFEFSRPDLEDDAEPMEIHYSLEGLAENGVDYEPLSGTIVIPAGEATAVLEIHALQDTETEGIEEIILNIDDIQCTCSNFPVSVILLIIDNVLVDAGEDVEICQGESIQLNATPADNVSYIWSNTPYLNDSTIHNPVATPAVTTTFGVQSVDEHGCMAEDNMTVFVVPPPALPAIVTDTTICSGEAIEYQISALSPVWGYTYQWSPATGLDDTTIPNPTVTLDASRTYTLTVTNAAGCDTTITVSLNASSVDVETALPDTAFCAGSSLVLSGENGFARYVWSTGDTTQSITIDDIGTYILTVYDENNCADTAVAAVTLYPSPEVSINGTAEINLGESTTLSTNSTYAQYLWNDGSANPTLEVSQAGTYQVMVSNEFGCSDTADFTLNVKIEAPFYIPTAFSPNNDQMNDNFRVFVDAARISTVELYVYNRWGNRVFGEKSAAPLWNGTFEGKEAEVGVYVYFGTVELINGERIDFKGNVTLVR